MNILTINSVDFSAFVNQRTWKVQNAKEYVTWVDGNRKTRRTLSRRKVTGTWTMTFTDPDDYDAFMAAIEAVTTNDDYAAITLYVDNEHQLMTINAFITLTTRTVWTQNSSQTPAVMLVTVKLEER